MADREGTQVENLCYENREGTQVENLCYEDREGTQVENLCYEDREGTQVENLCYENREGTQVENLCYLRTCATRRPEHRHRRPAACHGENQHTSDPKNTPDWDRTSNLQLRRLTLYPIELREQRTCGSLAAAPRPRKQRRFAGRTTTDGQPAAVMPTA